MSDDDNDSIGPLLGAIRAVHSYCDDAGLLEVDDEGYKIPCHLRVKKLYTRYNHMKRELVLKHLPEGSFTDLADVSRIILESEGVNLAAGELSKACQFLRKQGMVEVKMHNGKTFAKKNKTKKTKPVFESEKEPELEVVESNPYEELDKACMDLIDIVDRIAYQAKRIVSESKEKANVSEEELKELYSIRDKFTDIQALAKH